MDGEAVNGVHCERGNSPKFRRDHSCWREMDDKVQRRLVLRGPREIDECQSYPEVCCSRRRNALKARSQLVDLLVEIA